MCFYGSYVAMLLFQDEIRAKMLFELTFFDRLTGETVKSSYTIVFQYLFARQPLECSVLCIMFVMGIALTCFLGYHVSTRNENEFFEVVAASVFATCLPQGSSKEDFRPCTRRYT